MLSNNSPTSTNTDPLLAGHSHGGSTKRKSRPIGTIEYTVEDNETLEKIALKWNTVPSEIHRLNRLVTRVIFPGQVLFVPDPEYVPPPPSSPPTSPPTKALPLSIINEINTLETSSMAPQGVVVESPSTTTPTQTISSSNNSHNSSSSGIGSLFKWKQTTPQTRPGHVEKQSGSSSHLKHKSASQSDTSTSLHDDRSHERSRNKSLQSRHTLTEEEAKKLDQECMQRFLKINCKIVTRTKGCFEGVLIITPSALMFDPLPSSNLVAAAAKSNSSSNGHKYPSLRHSASIYDEASALIPIEIISNVIMYEDLALKDVQEYFDYQNDIESQHDETHQTNGNRKDTGSSGEVCFDLHTDSNETHEIHENSSSNNNKQTIKSDSGAGEESGLGGENKSSNSSSHHGEDGIFGTSNNPDVTTTPVLSAKSNESKETTKKSSTPVLENGGEIGDLSINDDSLLSSAPTTATTPSNNLLRHSTSSSPSHISCYLCIKVNKNRDFITCPMNRKMKNRLSSEFWFQINDNSTDKICAFFLEWKADPSSHISDELGNETDEESGDVPHGQFRLVKQNEKLNELISDALASSDAMLKSSPSTNRLINKNISSFVKDWEIVNLKEYEQKLRKEIEIEKEYKQLPNLRGESTILKEDHLRKLNVNLIPRAVGYNWHLTFSTELNGFSLNTMYRLLAEIDSPCLLVVMDTNRNVFGAMSPCKLYQSEHYYGTGESFLFTFFPSFRIFKWTGENNFFIRGNAESIGFGCAEGYHGLWFDGDLLNGHTQRSKTYDNDMLTSTEYFTIAAIEVWTFSD